MGRTVTWTDQEYDTLRELADAVGVATEFWDFDGNHRTTPTDVLQGVLSGLGHDVSTPQAVRRALQALRDAPWRQILPPVVVATQGVRREFTVHIPHGRPVQVWVEVDGAGDRIAVEQVDRLVPPREIDGELIGEATFVVPDAPIGWHEFVARMGEGEPEVRAPLAIAPPHAPQPQGRPEFRDRSWGLMAQLYSVRSARSWGLGDFADLNELAAIGGHSGADFLLINPLHAGEPVSPITPSPYLPTTRRFIHPIYIRPEQIEEAAYLPTSQRTLVEWGHEEISPSNSDSSPIDRDAVWRVKSPALETIFQQRRSGSRQYRFEQFRAEMGQGLEDFALWCAIVEKYERAARPLTGPDSDAGRIAALRQELAERITYYIWLQWVADEQLAHAQRTARESGMKLGIMHDLAVGVHPSGADSWALSEVLGHNVSVGAPPDMYNQQGQNWSQPPWRPDALAAAGYAPLRDMVRTIARHAGALRLDHVMGLFRLWLIPDGFGADNGTYVRYDHEALVSIVVLEAHLAGAVLIGEDLGNVEPWVRDYLADRGILGTSVLWFEKNDQGGPLPPRGYRREVLATVTTHDLPPTAGYLADEHVELRERLGLLTQPVAQVRLEAQTERERMARALREHHVLPDQPTERQIVEALHRYIAQAPSTLIGVALTDAVGERRAQNQPGTDQEYPNWRIPLADGVQNVVLVEDLAANVRYQSLVLAVTEELQIQR